MTILRTKHGYIEGEQRNGYYIYKGIPYAKPPVGSLRFRAPQEMDDWEGVYKADKFPAGCMQSTAEENNFYTKEFYSNSDFSVPFCEDSLYLNIWTPAKSENDHLPVALWLHGGALLGGHGSEMEFDGEAYAKRGVILVTINYRVGIFGFLCHPWLAEENNGCCGNYGVLDQIAALKWVSDNIHVFGGDPENVTLFGQSAGALVSQTLMLSPLTKGLMKRCIMQSGAGYRNGFSKNGKQEDFYDLGYKAIEALGVKNIDELRAVTSERLLEVSNEMIGFYCSQGKGFGYEPVIDSYVLIEDSEEALNNGHYPDIVCMLGSTANDICTPEDETVPMEKSQLHRGCVDWSKHQIELGRQPYYVYYFKRRLPGDDAGAFHSSELWYMFGTLDRCWRPFSEEDNNLSRQMLDYWCNFMKTGNPNGNGNEDWKTWTVENPYVKILDISSNS